MKGILGEDHERFLPLLLCSQCDYFGNAIACLRLKKSIVLETYAGFFGFSWRYKIQLRARRDDWVVEFISEECIISEDVSYSCGNFLEAV